MNRRSAVSGELTEGPVGGRRLAGERAGDVANVSFACGTLVAMKPLSVVSFCEATIDRGSTPRQSGLPGRRQMPCSKIHCVANPFRVMVPQPCVLRQKSTMPRTRHRVLICR